MYKISVCMATHNGQLFIERQLASILKQLRNTDELIVVDDASVDNTLKIIDNLKDARIKVFSNPGNMGVVKTFEKALGKASGDIICLSDQDDIWLDNKMDTIISLFRARPDATLILSDAQIIDAVGNLVCPSFFAIRGRFSPGIFNNIIKNKYLGCTMVFKKHILQYSLPFPSDVPMHDMWIGVVNDVYGKTCFIEEPLIQYRRHDNNITSFRHRAFLQMLRWRLLLLKNVLLLIFRQRCRGS